MTYLIIAALLAILIWREARTTVKDIFLEIAVLSAPLTYISETDSPVHPYLFKGTMEQWLKQLGEFERREFLDFMLLRGPTFEPLVDVMDDNLSQLIVVKTGQVQRDVYAVGVFKGHVLGVRMGAVET